LVDATRRPEFADVDLTGGLSPASRLSINADMPLDAARQHVYAITASRVSAPSHTGKQHLDRFGRFCTV